MLHCYPEQYQHFRFRICLKILLNYLIYNDIIIDFKVPTIENALLGGTDVPGIDEYFLAKPARFRNSTYF